jgi:hypothetical protein
MLIPSITYHWRWCIEHTSSPLAVMEPPSGRSNHLLQNANVPKVLLMCCSNFCMGTHEHNTQQVLSTTTTHINMNSHNHPTTHTVKLCYLGPGHAEGYMGCVEVFHVVGAFKVLTSQHLHSKNTTLKISTRFSYDHTCLCR